MSKRVVKKSKISKLSPAAWAAIGVIIAAVFSSPVIVEFIKNKANNNTSSSQPAIRINIQDEYYHIGDVEYVTVFQNGEVVDKIYFSHREPQSNPFVKDFSLDEIPRQATLFISVKSIDPDEKKSPTKIFLNAVFLDFLNRYSTKETMDEYAVQIPVDVSFLRKGKNTLQIFVESTNLDFLGNIDDIEFRNIYLEMIP
jgi:hypothetical protein